MWLKMESIHEMAPDKYPVRREYLELDHKKLQGWKIEKERMAQQRRLGSNQKRQDYGVGGAKGEGSVRKEGTIFLRTEKCSLHLARGRAVLAE